MFLRPFNLQAQLPPSPLIPTCCRHFPLTALVLPCPPFPHPKFRHPHLRPVHLQNPNLRGFPGSNHPLCGCRSYHQHRRAGYKTHLVPNLGTMTLRAPLNLLPPPFQAQPHHRLPHRAQAGCRSREPFHCSAAAPAVSSYWETLTRHRARLFINLTFTKHPTTLQGTER